jgi:hypothetical protein
MKQQEINQNIRTMIINFSEHEKKAFLNITKKIVMMYNDKIYNILNLDCQRTSWILATQEIKNDNDCLLIYLCEAYQDINKFTEIVLFITRTEKNNELNQVFNFTNDTNKQKFKNDMNAVILVNKQVINKIYNECGDITNKNSLIQMREQICQFIVKLDSINKDITAYLNLYSLLPDEISRLTARINNYMNNCNYPVNLPITDDEYEMLFHEINLFAYSSIIFVLQYMCV